MLGAGIWLTHCQSQTHTAAHAPSADGSARDAGASAHAGAAAQSGASGSGGLGAAGVAGSDASITGSARDGGASGAGASAVSGSGGTAGGAGASGGGAVDAGPRATFRNPLNQKEGSDPWLTYYKGNYYLTATTWSSELSVRKSATIDGLKTATPVTVWTGDAAARCCNFWAPELHQLTGPSGTRWYLYYTAGPTGTDTSNQRNHVLESAGDDPLGPYSYKARIFDTNNDSWAIDSSVVTIKGSLYFLFSAWEGSNQDLFIALMSNPWTMSGSRVRISQPTYTWETSLANVNEGPVALQHDGHTFITYSASACWGPDYKLGMLTLTGTDPLSAASWTKTATPVFQRADANSAYGPGHNGFFTSPDGTENWIVYHANTSASGVCDTNRTTRVQSFTWNSDGTPHFGAPVALTTDLQVPSGE
ncbi:MAG TPA: glycoside hydrolase family 43 protein [Polyangiales bacterium]